MMMVVDFDSLFRTDRLMVILRGLPIERTVELAHLAWNAGVDHVEVPIGEPGQEQALAATVEAGRLRERVVGAGTVVSRGHVMAALAAGAGYTVAPGLDPEVVTASHNAGMPHLPGVATATEVQHASRLGCTWVKAFPATVLGPAWFRALSGPFPGVRFVATGGVSVDAAPDFLAAGARMVALGSALADPAQRDRLAALVARLR